MCAELDSFRLKSKEIVFNLSISEKTQIQWQEVLASVKSGFWGPVIIRIPKFIKGSAVLLASLGEQAGLCHVWELFVVLW